MSFSIGDLAVYPGYGVGKIVDIEKKEIMGSTAEFFAIELLENGSRLLVPLASAKAKGLRHVINDNEAQDVLDMLGSERSEQDKKLDSQTWNRRNREYLEKIKTGSVFEIACVMRDLFSIKASKELSFGEKKMLETTRTLLVKELSIATKKDEQFIEDQVEEIFEDRFS